MFVFDKRLSAEQAINFKPSSKAPFGYMPSLTLATSGTTVPNINCTDPTAVQDATTIAARTHGTTCDAARASREARGDMGIRKALRWAARALSTAPCRDSHSTHGGETAARAHRHRRTP